MVVFKLNREFPYLWKPSVTFTDMTQMISSEFGKNTNLEGYLALPHNVHFSECIRVCFIWTKLNFYFGNMNLFPEALYFHCWRNSSTTKVIKSCYIIWVMHHENPMKPITIANYLKFNLQIKTYKINSRTAGNQMNKLN